MEFPKAFQRLGFGSSWLSGTLTVRCGGGSGDVIVYASTDSVRGTLSHVFDGT